MSPSGRLDLSRTRSALEEGIAQGWHLGAQMHVHHAKLGRGAVIVGERRPGEPMTDDTLMLWLSAGKPITAMAVAQQVERGTLALDLPVAEWIPEFAEGGKAEVTVRHLLTHTAGLRAAEGLPETLSWEESVAAIAAAPLDPGWIPGERAAYQPQATWQILGELVQRVSGRPFPEHVREAVLLPWGMRETWLGMPPEKHGFYGARIGTTYSTFPREPVAHPTWDTAAACARCRPGSSARGPVSDLLAMYVALLEGGRGVVKEATLERFTRRERTGLFDETFRHVVDFGLGFLVNSSRHGPATVPYGYGARASDRTFGHSGSQSSCAFADPERACAVAWACNGLPGEPRHQRRLRALHAALEEDLALAEAAI